MITAKVFLTGNIGKVESSYTPKGEMLTKFSLAVNIGYGENKRVNWYNCVVWGKSGEMAQKLLKVGTCMFLEGKQEIREWEDKNGNKRQSIEVTVTDFNIISGGRENGEDSSAESHGEDSPY